MQQRDMGMAIPIGIVTKSGWTKRFASGALCLLVCITMTANARIRYIRPSGNDANDGSSIASAWQTIGKANATLVAGDTAYILAGTYGEQIRPARSGTPGHEIAYIGYQNDHVAIRTFASVGDEAQAYIGMDYVRLENLDLLPSNYGTFRVQQWVSTCYVITVAGNNCVLNRIRIPGGIGWTDFDSISDNLIRGINVDGNHITLSHCYVRGTDIGVVVSGDAPRYLWMTQDTIRASMWSLIQIGTPDTHAPQRNLIEHCIVDSSWGEDGIQFESTMDTSNIGTWIRYCKISNCGENLIDLKGGKDIVIEHNILYGSMGDDNGPYQGIHATWDSDRTGSAWTWGLPTAANAHTIGRFNLLINNAGGIDSYVGDYIYNNTLMNNRRFWNGSGYSPNQDAKLFAFQTYQDRPSSAVNNVFVGQAGVAHNGIIYGDFVTGAGQFRLDNNLYWEDPGIQDAPIFRDRHGIAPNQYEDSVHGLANWRRHISGYPLQGKDAHSVQADPRLHVPNYPTGYDPSMDFSADAQSPLIDAGTYLAITIGSGLNSTALTVDNPGAFTDGMGIPGVLGDSIWVGGITARVIQVNGNTLALDKPISWASGAGVFHWPFNGRAPDIGAFESEFSTPDTVPLPQALTTIIANSGFETGTAPWQFFSNGAGTFSSSTPGDGSPQAGRIAIVQKGNNEQLYQSGCTLQPATRYRLTFDAYSVSGHGLEVSLFSAASPTSNYGLSAVRFALTTGWKTWTVDFITPATAGQMNDARLQFWFAPYSVAGDVYFLDNVQIAKADSPPADPRQLGLPDAFTLEQNTPNPFNPATTIRYKLRGAMHVSLKVYDVLGRAVATLVDEFQSAGPHVIGFEAGQLSSGIYFYRMQTPAAGETRRMLLVK